MRWLKQLFTIQPVATPGLSAATYVPWVMVSRGLSFIRTLIVARLLGEMGKSTFGLYQPALEFINPLAALVMFGAADVAERYAAAMLKNIGPHGLRGWLHRQWLRLALTGIGVSVLLVATARWISTAIWGASAWIYANGRWNAPTPWNHSSHTYLFACGTALALLALYQHLAGVLRGLRAYAAAAGMELFGAVLLLSLSAAAAWYGRPSRLSLSMPVASALWLIIAYAASLGIPLLLYGFFLNRHLRQSPPHPMPDTYIGFKPNDVLSYAPRWTPPRLNHFAVWALVRLLLVLLFGFFSLWGVRYLAEAKFGGSAVSAPLESTASFSMPFRIAQLLSFLAITLWASSYGIAARAWSHGQVRRAKVQMFRVGRLGTATLTLLAVALLLSRGLFAWALPAYASPINALLPGMLALFLWYGLATFFAAYADLRESPQRGAAIWGTAVLVQIAGIAAVRFGHFDLDPQSAMLGVSTAGLLAALLLVTPWLLCRPIKLSATGTPLVVLGAAAGMLFAPAWLVNWIAPPVMLGAVPALYLTGYLIRPIDRRAFKKWRSHGTTNHPPLTTDH